MTEANEPQERAEPAEPTEPTERKEPAEPTDATQPIEPTEPTDMIEPLDAIERSESSDQSDMRERSLTAETTLPVLCQKHQTRTVGPAPEMVAPIAPSSLGAAWTSSRERGYRWARC